MPWPHRLSSTTAHSSESYSCEGACLLQGRAVSLRRRLHGRELGMRYASLDASTLRREAIRGLLNPSNKPASQLNALAVFAGARSACRATPSLAPLPTA